MLATYHFFLLLGICGGLIVGFGITKAYVSSGSQVKSLKKELSKKDDQLENLAKSSEAHLQDLRRKFNSIQFDITEFYQQLENTESEINDAFKKDAKTLPKPRQIVIDDEDNEEDTAHLAPELDSEKVRKSLSAIKSIPSILPQKSSIIDADSTEEEFVTTAPTFSSNHKPKTDAEVAKEASSTIPNNFDLREELPTNIPRFNSISSKEKTDTQVKEEKPTSHLQFSNSSADLAAPTRVKEAEEKLEETSTFGQDQIAAPKKKRRARAGSFKL